MTTKQRQQQLQSLMIAFGPAQLPPSNLRPSTYRPYPVHGSSHVCLPLDASRLLLLPPLLLLLLLACAAACTVWLNKPLQRSGRLKSLRRRCHSLSESMTTGELSHQTKCISYPSISTLSAFNGQGMSTVYTTALLYTATCLLRCTWPPSWGN